MTNDVRSESNRVRRLFRERFTFQISVDTPHVPQGLAVAEAALKAGVTILELGTPLLKYEGVRNVVPIFRQRFPTALLLADMKTMDGGEGEANAVYGGGGNVIDFLALRARRRPRRCARCAMRSARPIRRSRGSPSLTSSFRCRDRPGRRSRQRSACSTPAWTASAFTCSTTPGGPTPALFQGGYLHDVACAVFESVGASASVQVVGGLSVEQAIALARKGLRAFVISGNLGLPDAKSRYGLPGDEIERHIRDFIDQVSAAG